VCVLVAYNADDAYNVGLRILLLMPLRCYYYEALVYCDCRLQYFSHDSDRYVNINYYLMAGMLFYS